MRAPSGRPPSPDDDNKQVAREQARLGLNPPAMPVADNPQPRTIGLEPVQPQEMLCRALLMRLDLRTPSPILSPVTMTQLAYHFHGILRKLNSLLTAEQRQQNEDALVRPLPGKKSELPLQRSARTRTWSPALRPSRCGSSTKPPRSRDRISSIICVQTNRAVMLSGDRPMVRLRFFSVQSTGRPTKPILICANCSLS